MISYSISAINVRMPWLLHTAYSLCPQGWHSYSEPMKAPHNFDEHSLSRFSPYLARILTLLRHNTKLYLDCIDGPTGEGFLHWLEEVKYNSF